MSAVLRFGWNETLPVLFKGEYEKFDRVNQEHDYNMVLFLYLQKKFPEKPELLRNMLGLLGNVAEVPELRPRLMTSEFISVFAELLNSTSDGIEVSYNAAGVLAHIASDGPEIWTISSPTREDVLASLVKNIERWDLGIDRNINYRSMEPIFRLVRCFHQSECQHWAVWALANLTKVKEYHFSSYIL